MSQATTGEKTRTSDKGTSFDGLWSGKGYLTLTKLFGFTKSFYEKALGDIGPEGDVTVLDLGCGPGVFGALLAQKLTPASAVHGIDLSEDQIRYAQERTKNAVPPMHFRVGSMDDLPFADATFDLVITSMAMHEAAPDVRPRTIGEVSRVLKPGGRFLLVDWCKPRFGFWGIVWLPLLLLGKNNGKNRDNWNNLYMRYCEDAGMSLVEDRYVNSLTRRQLFRKP